MQRITLAGLFNSKGSFILIIFLAIIAIAAIFILVLVLRGNKTSKQILSELENKKDQIQIHSVLTKLNRIETIGHNNVVFNEAYQELKKRYDAIILTFNSEYSLLHDEAMKCADLKDKKDFKKSLKRIEELESSTLENLKMLEKDVEFTIKDDIELKSKEADIRKTIKECEAIIQNNNSSVRFMRNELNEFFNEIEQNMTYFNDYLLRGSIVDAKEVFDNVSKKVIDFRNCLDKLPYYANLVALELPNTINSVIEEFNEMHKSDYKMYNIPVSQSLNEAKAIHSSLVNDIRKFKFDDFDLRITQIKNSVKDIHEQLIKEKVSKEEYQEISSSTSDEANRLIRNYNNLIQSMNNIKKKYKTNDDNDDKVLSDAVSLLRALYNSLNTYTIGQYPYSIRISKLDELKCQIEIVKGLMQKTKEDYDTREKTSEIAIKNSAEAKSEIRNLELDIENSGYEKISEMYLDQLKELDSLAREIDDLLSKGQENEQIEIDVVSSKLKRLTQSLKEISDSIFNTISNARIAEAMIVYSNNFRADDQELAREITKAEIYFADGRYEECLSYCDKALKNYSTPNFAERLK